MEFENNNHTDYQVNQNPVILITNEDAYKKSLLNKMRLNFSVFGGLSLIFGTAFTALFYKSGIGINVLIFTVIMVVILNLMMMKLTIPIKKGTIACYIAVILLGLSTMLTASGILIFLNIIGILFLLDISLLHQFNEDGQWDVIHHIGRIYSLLFYCIISIGYPFIESFGFFKNSKSFRNKKTQGVIIGIIISIPILLIMAALLSSADLMFAKLTERLFDFIFSNDIITVIIMTLFGFVACYSILYGTIDAIKEQKVRRKMDTSIINTVMILLCFMYLLFCSIQIFYLFTNGLFQLPQEFTFAEYARRGFFELLTVTIINIFLILLSTTFFQSSKLLRTILTIITICTYIMIASAVYRMLLYIGAYHLTFLRLFVLLFLFIDVFLLAGVIVKVYRDKFPLFYYSTIVISVCYIAFSFSKPDHYIATYFMKKNETINAGELSFLTNELSLDAAPVVISYIKKNDELSQYWNDLQEKEKVTINYDWNSPFYILYRYHSKINTVSENQRIRGFNVAKYMAVLNYKESMK